MIGSYLRFIRKEKNVTATELSLKIGYSRTYISCVENNKKTKPSQKFLEAYIYALTENVKEVHEIKSNINKLMGKKMFDENKTIPLVDQYERGYDAGYKEAKQLVVQELLKSKTTEEKAKILDELMLCLIKQ